MNLDGRPLAPESATPLLAAMGSLAENRVTFLDYRLVEFLARVPVEHHGALFVSKQILRRAADPLLPKAFAWRPKWYFFSVRTRNARCE